MPALLALIVSLAAFAAALGPTPVVAQTMTPSYQGLWWRSPAGSESGWGVNIAHQGDVLFATWFTYDADGNALWLVMSAGNRDMTTGEDPYYGGYGMMDPGPISYTGTLYRTTGPAFDSAPFDPARVAVSPVGTATFAFTSPDRGTFSYIVNGVARSLPIVRQEYATPVPHCELGGSRGAADNYQDLWWNAPAGSESGWGLNIVHQGGILFVTWFTYDAAGRGLWLVMSDGRRTGPATFSGALYRATGPAYSEVPWDGAKVRVDPVGSATLSFSGPDSGTFAYTVNGVAGSKAIVREVFATPASVCASP